MKPAILAAFSLFALALPSSALGPQDWPHWRGPSYDGSTSVSDLPLEFDQTKNVVWSAALPGPSAATPIVFGRHVYVTAADAEAGALLTIAFDRETGEELWAQAAPKLAGAEGADATRIDDRSTYAAPSPVADAERVISLFGSGALVAYDVEGETLWARNLQADYGAFQFQWTFSTSPTLFDGKLFLQLLQRDEPVHDRGEAEKPSFLLALDPHTGKTIYEHVRPSKAKRESLESYATPIPLVAPGAPKQLLVAGGDVLTAHDPADGSELWRWGTWNAEHRELWWRLVPTPVVGGNLALVCAPKGAPVYAVKLGGKGELGADALAWQSEGRRTPVTSDVPTPLFYQGDFFVLSDLRESLSRVDAATGSVEWTVDLPGKALWRASPTGADGRIYCMNHAGLVLVVAPEDGKLLHQAQMGEPDDDQICSTIAAAHGRLFVRTNSRLFCIGRAAGAAR